MAARTPRVGRTLGAYELEERIGAGGQSTVFRARGPHGVVAIKVHVADDDPSTRTAVRFRREAQILAQLNNPHIVRVFEYGEEGGCQYMVQEYVDGTNLAGYLEHTRLSAAQTHQLAESLLDGLCDAHAAGVLHRDIKPSNVLVQSHGDDLQSVKLIDFGVARQTTALDRAVTTTAAALGTAAYMSPEQVFGETLTATSDLYSLGLTLLEARCGYPAVEDWQRAVISRQLTASAPPVVPTELTPPLAALVERLSATFVHERFPTAAHAARALSAQPRPGSKLTHRPTSGVSRKWRSIAAVAGGAAVGAALILTQFPRQQELPDRAQPRSTRPVATEAAPAAVAPAALEPLAARESEATACEHELTPGVGWIEFGSDFEREEMLGYVPRDYGQNARNPVIVILHGVHEKHGPGSLLQEFNLYETADSLGALILAPNGELPKRSLGDVLGQMRGRWSKFATFERWSQIVEIASSNCGDLDRVFVIGKGLGAHGADELACAGQVAGTITWGHQLSHAGKLRCRRPTTAKPYLLLTPTRNPGRPIAGCRDCERSTLPLAEQEKLLLPWNRCVEPSKPFHLGSSLCRTWDCETNLVSCEVDAGVHLPAYDQGSRASELATDFPFSDVVEAFVRSNGESVIPTSDERPRGHTPDGGQHD